MALVVDGPAAVRQRCAVLRGDLAGLHEQFLGRTLAAQQLLRAREMDGGRPHRAQRDPGIGDRAVLHPDGGGRRRNGPVAGTPLDLLVRAAGTGTERQPHLSQQLTVADRRGEWADVELVQAYDALAARAANYGPRLQRRADRRQVLCRIGLAERAADRAAVADDGVRNHLLRIPEDRETQREQIRLQEVDVTRQRPDPHLAALLPDVGELGEVVDVDQVLRVRQPELHHRQQAVTAGDDSRLRTEPLERLDGAVNAGRTLVLE